MIHATSICTPSVQDEQYTAPDRPAGCIVQPGAPISFGCGSGHGGRGMAGLSAPVGGMFSVAHDMAGAGREPHVRPLNEPF